MSECVRERLLLAYASERTYASYLSFQRKTKQMYPNCSCRYVRYVHPCVWRECVRPCACACVLFHKFNFTDVPSLRNAVPQHKIQLRDALIAVTATMPSGWCLVSRHERLPLDGSTKRCQSALSDGDVLLESVNINLPREMHERVVTVEPIKRTVRR